MDGDNTDDDDVITVKFKRELIFGSEEKNCDDDAHPMGRYGKDVVNETGAVDEEEMYDGMEYVDVTGDIIGYGDNDLEGKEEKEDEDEDVADVLINKLNNRS
jgi:hypothetical protein